MSSLNRSNQASRAETHLFTTGSVLPDLVLDTYGGPLLGGDTLGLLETLAGSARGDLSVLVVAVGIQERALKSQASQLPRKSRRGDEHRDSTKDSQASASNVDAYRRGKVDATYLKNWRQVDMMNAVYANGIGRRGDICASFVVIVHRSDDFSRLDPSYGGYAGFNLRVFRLHAGLSADA
jgi:hypothetical protein